MKTKILITITIILASTLLISAHVEPQIYYKINLDYDKGSLNITSVEIEFFQNEITNYYGEYAIRVLDYEQEIINTTYFEVPNVILWDGINPETGEIDRGGMEILDQVSFEVYVPYSTNAKAIIIYDKDARRLTEKNIEEFSITIPEISQPEDETQEPEIEKPKITKEKITQSLSQYWYILAIILILLLGVLISSLRKKK